MNNAEKFVSKHGFVGPNYWYNDDGNHLMETLSDTEWSVGGVEFVMVRLMMDGVEVETIGYMFEDDSMIVDLGPRWSLIPPSWQNDELEVVEAE